MSTRLLALAAAGGLWMAGAAAYAAQLKPETNQAFEQYIRKTEARLDGQVRSGDFLWVDAAPDRLAAVRRGQVLTRTWTPTPTVSVPDGLIHDWIGAVFIPGATLNQALAFVQDYDHHKQYYGPEVMDSKLLARHGNDFRIYMRLLKKKVITVVLDTEHEVHYAEVDPHRWYSRSRTTSISEVQDAGKPGERKLPSGTGHGFLWRLNSYWKFQERDGGVYLECEAISLTRDVPTGLGWLISPIVRDLPRQSLEHTLEATRAALVKNQNTAASERK
jgi:hypothetical protein